MIKQLLKLFIFLTVTNVFGQDTIRSIAYTWPQPVSYFEDRDTANYFHFNTGNNIWQIGTPNKTVFDSAYSPTLALVTDTLNPYPNGNQSSFEFVIYTDDATSIEFWHRYNSDSLADGGVVELSTDGGANWTNVINSPLILSTSNFYTAANTISSNGNKAGFTGNSNWVHSGLYGYALYFVRFRFTFTSDNTNSNKDGWMLDNFTFTCLGTGITEVGGTSPFHLSPNPTSDFIHIRSEYPKKFTTATLKDITGKTILTTDKTTIDFSNLDCGLYFVEIKTDEEMYVSRIIRE